MISVNALLLIQQHGIEVYKIKVYTYIKVVPTQFAKTSCKQQSLLDGNYPTMHFKDEVMC